MFKKITLIMIIALVAVFLFSACSRSASKVPLATPTAQNPNSTPQPTSLSLVQVWGTSTSIYLQTAQAAGIITAAPATDTPVPAQVGTASTPVVPPTGAPTNTPMPGNTPVVVAATPAPGRPASYTLHGGEFPYCLARRFDVNPTDLMSLNGLVDGQVLQPGVVLRIPSTGSFPGNRAWHAHPASYTVNVNDSFYSIACYFGDIDPATIASTNGLALSSPLTTGKILTIP
jgi:LysM repeat protein